MGGLESGDRPVGAVTRGGVTAPEAELATGRGDELVGDEPHDREPGGGVLVLRLRVAAQPAVELPAHAGDERGGGERPLVPPPSDELLAVLGLGLDDDLGAGQPARGEPLEEPVGEGLRGERGLLEAGGGRVELARLDELGGRRRRWGGVLVEALGEPMGARAPVGPNRASTAARGSCGEVAEAPQPKLGEQRREIVVLEHGDGPRGEEGRGIARRDDLGPARRRGAGREPGGEGPVGDADAHVAGSPPRRPRRARVCDRPSSPPK